MFTGIVEELGKIASIEWKTSGARFHISAHRVLEDAKIGDSISVNGCCLTLVDFSSQGWYCDVVQETLDRTNFRLLKEGDSVNLERAIRYQDRLGGHLVQGHIDDVGTIKNKQALSDGSWQVTIQLSPDLMKYLVYKGSIAVDGVSLTIATLGEKDFSFAMIPHTAQVTTLGIKKPGELVNLEVDLMAKYIERLLVPFQFKSDQIGSLYEHSTH
ncbi:riboflavin synthase [Candidatus Protochlamydia phocaeensis]|uniref:riboflavin synthase n=1 Tax=Candidatus Protochlamydia phocaeensis TaxID=1414722 RepID=UPI0008384CF5|nr:riboflavin synthase [Candidatus Protochlamydia phocaeensis]